MAFGAMTYATEGETGSSDNFNQIVTNVLDLETRKNAEIDQNTQQDQWMSDHVDNIHPSMQSRVDSLKSGVEFPGSYGGEWLSVNYPSGDLTSGSTTYYQWWDTPRFTPSGITTDGTTFTIQKEGVWVVHSTLEVADLSADFQGYAYWIENLNFPEALAKYEGKTNGANVRAIRRFNAGDEFRMNIYLYEPTGIRNADCPPYLRAYWIGY